MTVKEFDQLSGELAEAQDAEASRREEVNARTLARLKEPGEDPGLNPPMPDGDFWPDEVYP